jgi:hypothetical protein
MDVEIGQNINIDPQVLILLPFYRYKSTNTDEAAPRAVPLHELLRNV